MQITHTHAPITAIVAGRPDVLPPRLSPQGTGGSSCILW